MGCCGEREKLPPTTLEQTWDYIVRIASPSGTLSRLTRMKESQ